VRLSQPLSTTTMTTRVGWYQKNFWIFMEQGKIMGAEVPTVRVGATPTGLTVPHPHNPPRFFTGWMPFLPPNQPPL